MAAERIQKILERIGTAAVLIGSGASLIQFSMYDVPGGHRAVIFDRFQGVRKEVIGEGQIKNQSIADAST